MSVPVVHGDSFARSSLPRLLPCPSNEGSSRPARREALAGSCEERGVRKASPRVRAGIEICGDARSSRASTAPAGRPCRDDPAGDRPDVDREGVLLSDPRGRPLCRFGCFSQLVLRSTNFSGFSLRRSAVPWFLRACRAWCRGRRIVSRRSMPGRPSAPHKNVGTGSPTIRSRRRMCAA